MIVTNCGHWQFTNGMMLTFFLSRSIVYSIWQKPNTVKTNRQRNMSIRVEVIQWRESEKTGHYASFVTFHNVWNRCFVFRLFGCLDTDFFSINSTAQNTNKSSFSIGHVPQSLTPKKEKKNLSNERFESR